MALAAGLLAACGPRMADEGDGCNTDCRSSGSRQWCVEHTPVAGANLVNTQVLGFRGGVVVSGDASLPPEHTESELWLLHLDAEGAQIWETTIPVASGEFRQIMACRA